jgi:hypothetical protein
LNTPYGAVIVGAGSLDLATGHELLRRFTDARPAIIDNEESPDRHQSRLMKAAPNNDLVDWKKNL